MDRFYSRMLVTYQWILVLFAFSLPFSVPGFQLSNVLMFVLFALGLGLLYIQKPVLNKLQKLTFFLYVSFFAIQVAGYFYSTNTAQATSDLEKKLPFVILPLALLATTRMPPQIANKALTGFVAGCAFALTVCYSRAFFFLLAKGNASFFEYHAFSDLINVHPAYLAMYLCFGIAVLFSQMRQSNQNRFKQIGLIIVFSLSVVILSARMQLVILILMCGVLVLKFSPFSFLKTFLLGILVTTVMVAMILAFPQNRDRIREAFNKDETRWGEQQIRGSIWPCAAQVISGNFFFGVGTGDAQDVLEECYRSNDYVSLTYWEGVRFNAHNQYFQVMINNGVFGFLIFMTILAALFYHQFSSPSIMGIAFLIIITLSFLTESMLERQRGILFFSFFIPFILFNFSAELHEIRKENH